MSLLLGELLEGSGKCGFVGVSEMEDLCSLAGCEVLFSELKTAVV